MPKLTRIATRKDFLTLSGSLLLLLSLLFAFRDEIYELFTDNITRDMFVDGDADAFDPGLPLGSHMPPLRARHGGRVVSDLSEFMGPRGLVLVAARSIDWCPYCRRQMVQLGEQIDDFRSAGVGVVGLTYDETGLQQAFSKKHALQYPLLSDINTASVRALDILNPEYPPEDDHFGVPYPGTFIVAPDGTIVGKLFLQDYRVRVAAQHVLAAALAALPAP